MLSPLPGSLSPLAIGSRRATWQTYIAARAPLLWYRFNESSGNALNSGSVGSTDGTLTNMLQAQTGQLGASEAYADGVGGGIVSVPYVSAWGDLTTLTWVFLCRFDSGAGSTNERIIGREVGYFCLNIGATNGIRVTMRNSATTQFNTDTSTTVARDDTWHLVSFSYDDAGDRTPHIFIDGIEASYAATAPVTGTLQFMTSGLTLFNNQANNADMNGYIDEAALFNYVWSSTEHSTAKTLAGL